MNNQEDPVLDNGIAEMVGLLYKDQAKGRQTESLAPGSKSFGVGCEVYQPYSVTGRE